MNLVNKEYHKRARVLLENWQDGVVFSTSFVEPSNEDLASKIVLSLLTPDASISEVNKLCKAAREYALRGVCVNPGHVERCVQLLGDDIPVGTVVGFPLGANHPQIKVAEARLAANQGAKSLSLALNIGLLKTSNFQDIFEELRAVRYACPEADLSIILETTFLEPLQVIVACMLSRESGADDVMTSTGFSSLSATPENVSLMRSVVGDDLGVRASGTINDRESMFHILKAGATGLILPFLVTSESLYGLTKYSDRPVDE